MDYDRKKLGWHFVEETLRDGRPIPPDGEWLTHDGPAKMCEAGLHLGATPWDALKYAPGATLCLVEYADEVDRDEGKILCRQRRIIARMDATDLLRYYARMQAVSALNLWDQCPPDAVLDYLMTGEENLRDAAWDAAWAAARAAAWDAAWDAARDAFNSLVYECFEGWL